MSQHSINSNSDLANSCVAYLAEEALHIEAMLQSVKSIRAALLDRDTATLQSTLDQLTAATPTQLTKLRSEIRTGLADATQTPVNDVNLQQIVIYAAKTLGVDIISTYESMKENRQEIERLNRANMTMMAALSKMIDRFIALVTGEVTSPTYGRHGSIQHSKQAHMIERHC